MPDERRVAAERQALDRQNLPESPERLRQQDALLQGAAQLAEAAVEREGAAYEEGVRAGRRVSTFPAAPVAQPSAVEQGEQGSGDQNTGLQVRWSYFRYEPAVCAAMRLSWVELQCLFSLQQPCQCGTCMYGFSIG